MTAHHRRAAWAIRCALLLVAVLLPAAAGRADTRVAYSEALHVEILAASPAWCGEHPTFGVVAESAETFRTPHFLRLLHRFGRAIVAKSCPAARSIAFAGRVRSGPVVWRGHAEGGEWDVREAEMPPAAPPAPPPASPLLGDWSGTLACGANNERRITVSIADLDGLRAHAVVDIARQAAPAHLRYRAEGHFDPPSGQLQLAETERLSEDGDAFPRLSGRLLPGGAALLLDSPCNGQPARLAHQSAEPRLANRLATDLQLRAAWIAEAARAPHPWRLVGLAPAGTYRAPDCPALLAWAAATPLDARVRLVPGMGGPGALRHFDDAHSAPLFGTPAYDLFEPPARGLNGGKLGVDLAGLVRQECGRSPDPRLRMLDAVVRDGQFGATRAEFTARRAIDRAVDSIAATLATTGGSAEEAYAALAPLTDPAKLPGAMARFAGIPPNVLLPEERGFIAADANRLRARLVAPAMAEAMRQIAALPADEAGRHATGEIAARFTATFGEAAAEPVRARAAERRRQIAETLLDHRIAELHAAPPTLAALGPAVRTAREAADRLAPDAPDAPARMAAAIAATLHNAAPAITAEATAALAAIPAGPDGVAALARQRAAIVALYGPDAPDLASYRAAADARLDALAAGVGNDLATKLAALPPGWDSVHRARSMAAEAAAPFGDSPAGARLRGQGEARAAALRKALADQAIASLGAMPAGDLLAVIAFMQDAARIATPFAQDPGGAPAAAAIGAAAVARASALATADFPAFQASLRSLPATHWTALRLARAAAALDRMMAELPMPALIPYRDAALQAARAAEGAGCGGAVAAYGLTPEQARLPTVIGWHTGPLGELVCDLVRNGAAQGDLKPLADAPGGYALTMFRAPSREAPPHGREPLSITRQMLREIFTFEPPYYEVTQIVFRMLEVAPQRSALVGVAQGDGAKMAPSSIAEWRSESADLASGHGEAPPDAATCRRYAETPLRLDLDTAARALLGCAGVK